MPLRNTDIAKVFQDIADLLEIGDADPFRIRAYRNAARTVGQYKADLSSLVARGEPLPKIPGVGADLAGKIVEICTTGQCAQLARLQNEAPPAIAALLTVPGLGPRRVQTLYRELEISTPRQLREAARRGAIRELSGFGARIETKILEALARYEQSGRRMPRALAQPYAERFVAQLGRVKGVARIEAAGSYRRGRDTVGDLDIVVASDETSGRACLALTEFEEVGEVLARGRTRASVLLSNGLQVDLRVVEPQSYGAALLYFTGSKAHNIALRRLALNRGLKINEYGVYREEERLAGATEEEVYALLDLPWIAPELREDRGEIEAARQNRLPHLLRRADLRGDLHAHSRAGIGRDSALTLARAARAQGLEYIAITNQLGADADGFAQWRRQAAEIDRARRAENGVEILKGAEVEILEDGSLGATDELLEQMDFVVGAVRDHLDLPRAEQTARLLRALENPALDMLAHPGGRLIGRREGSDIDMWAVLMKAAERGCALELDAQPERLDMTDSDCLAAKELGVPVCVDSDAHGADELRYLDNGIVQARRGWLEASDVLNTRSLAQLRRWRAQRREGAARPH